jgi:retrograde regulation protein 2
MNTNCLHAYIGLEVPKHMVERAKQQRGFRLYLSRGGFRGWGYLLLYQNEMGNTTIQYPSSMDSLFQA